MIGIAVASAVGTAVGAVGLGAASVAAGHPGGLAIALQHIPVMAPGHSVVSAVQNALEGGAVGGGIGGAVAAVAKGIGKLAGGV